MKAWLPLVIVTAFVVACGGTPNSSVIISSSQQFPVTLFVWAPNQEQVFIKARAEEFQTMNPQWDITFNFLVVSEVDAKGLLLLDIENGGDIFAFPDDQLESIVEAGGLSEIVQFKESVETRNVPWTVDVATVGDKLYGYPNTADNGTYMYYDKRLITEEEMGDFDTIVAKAKQLDTSINVDPMGGWSMAMWFTATNNIAWSRIDWEQSIDWNNDAGIRAAQTMMTYYATNRLIADGLLLPTQFVENNEGNLQDGAIAGMSGYWHTNAILNILGDNMGTVKMPTYTSVDGNTYQFGSMVGARMLGVNAYTRYPAAAHAFANYLTSEEVQFKRAIELFVAPSNMSVAAMEDVQALPTFKALADQSPFGIPQARSVSQYYWNPADAFAKAIMRDARDVHQQVAAARAVNPLLDENQLYAQFLAVKFENIPGYLNTLVDQVTTLPPKPNQ
jgi:arabinogalactan oligomer / maltooligosaccharide transport system substrate-binding protein